MRFVILFLLLTSAAFAQTSMTCGAFDLTMEATRGGQMDFYHNEVTVPKRAGLLKYVDQRTNRKNQIILIRAGVDDGTSIETQLDFDVQECEDGIEASDKKASLKIYSVPIGRSRKLENTLWCSCAES